MKSKFNEQLFDSICDRIADGETLRQICRDTGMPNWRTFYDWLEGDDKLGENGLGLSARFARAREAGFDKIAEETLEIADDGTNDWMEKQDKDGGNAGYVLNGEHVQRSKLRIETRLKLLAKWSPKKYGDKVELSGPGEKGEFTFQQVDKRPELTKEEWLKAHGLSPT